MTSTSAAARSSARAANSPPKPQPTITIRALAAPCNAPLRQKDGNPNRSGGDYRLFQCGAGGAPAKTVHPLLAERDRLGGPKGSRLEPPCEPQTVEERGEADGGVAQVEQ